MEFSFMSVTMIVVAAVIAILGAKLLLARGWLAGFLRGFSGFSLLLLAAIITLSSINLATYQKVSHQQVYVQVHFKQLADQHYKVSITNSASGEVAETELFGDTWQLAVERIRLLSDKTAYYQVATLSSRYYALEQEAKAAQQEKHIKASSVGLNLAYWLHSYKDVKWAATSWKTVYSPMADGASFSVVVTEKGLNIEAINAAAQSALNEWL